MNYRHIYHAGNFADVFKHILLLGLTEAMQRKEAGFCYLETHAGIGRYDLLATEAQKSKEFLQGAAKILAADHAPLWAQRYREIIQSLNPDGQLRYYPGSPLLVKQLLRSQDRAVLSELHDDDVVTLKKLFAHDKQVHVHHRDGYESLKALLPPKERRGLILIDPPYEKADEFERLPELLAEAVTHFETGVYAVWFPIKQRAQLLPFYRALKQRIARPMLTAELCVYPDDMAGQLNGSGMLMVNPPWQFDQELKTMLPWLLEHLRVDAKGRERVAEI